MTTPDLSAGEFQALYEKLKRMSRWGPDDRRGALNHISAADVVAASSDVWRGRTVSLGAPVESRRAPDNPAPCLHQTSISSPGPARPDGLAPRLSFAMDRMAMNVHGDADSHIDALCHVLYDGLLYNDVPAQAVTAAGVRLVILRIRRRCRSARASVARSAAQEWLPLSISPCGLV